MDMYQKRKERQEKKNSEDNKNVLNKSVINWYPGHMAKTKRQIIEDLKLIDVVVEILDARIPFASQNPDVKSMIGDKKKIIVLNKCDLADERENDRWIKYFQTQGIKAVLTDANSGRGIQEVIKQVELVMQAELEIHADKGRVGRAIRVLVLGIPNVGKSSFINRIAKKTSAEVGNKPGVTKKKQWIRVAENIELLDTPGVLWPRFENEKVGLKLAYTGTIRDDIIDKTEVAFSLLKFLVENYLEQVCQRYKITKEEIEQILESYANPNEGIFEVMNFIGKKRGAIVSGGKVDEAKVANLLVEDFRSCKLGRISIERAK